MSGMHLLRLYNREPLYETIGHNELLVYQYTQTKSSYMALPQDKFIHLVNLVLITTQYTFNSQFYQQTDCVTMGTPASSTTAEIYMQAHENTAISTALHPPKVCKRFADDVNSIRQCMHLENVFHYINNLHQNTSVSWHFIETK